MKIEGWPTCAKCGGPVKEMMSGPNARSRGIDLVVRCHGAQEEMFISDAELADAHGVTLAVAFKDAKKGGESVNLGPLSDRSPIYKMASQQYWRLPR